MHRDPVFARLAGALLTLSAGAMLTLTISVRSANAAVCEGYENVLFCGELTGDCLVTASDALAALRMVVGLDAGVAEADMDNSGVVTAVDALGILRVAVALDPQTSVCDDPAVLTLDAEDSGFYVQNGDYEPGNYAVGWYAAPNDDELRDYFVFDVPAVAGNITSAVLSLTTAPPGYIVYGSSDPSETYTLFEVSITPATLTDGSGGIGAFDDLGQGEAYGSFVATSSLGATAEIDLNAAGIAALSAASGQVAIGGAITTLAAGATNEFLFNSTSAALTRQLTITIE